MNVYILRVIVFFLFIHAAVHHFFPPSSNRVLHIIQYATSQVFASRILSLLFTVGMYMCH